MAARDSDDASRGRVSSDDARSAMVQHVWALADHYCILRELRAIGGESWSGSSACCSSRRHVRYSNGVQISFDGLGPHPLCIAYDPHVLGGTFS